MESGNIPPNLHYNHPRRGVEALSDGRLEVITEPTPWEGGYVGINSFGFGGVNGHVLLKSNPKKKLKNSALVDDLPRLVIVSGRTEGAVATLLDDVCERTVLYTVPKPPHVSALRSRMSGESIKILVMFT